MGVRLLIKIVVLLVILANVNLKGTDEWSVVYQPNSLYVRLREGFDLIGEGQEFSAMMQDGFTVTEIVNLNSFQYHGY